MDERAMTPNDEREMALNRLGRIKPMLLEMHDIDGQLVQRTTEIQQHVSTAEDDDPVRAIVTFVAACECAFFALFVLLSGSLAQIPTLIIYVGVIAVSTYLWVYWEPPTKSWLKVAAPIVFGFMTLACIGMLIFSSGFLLLFSVIIGVLCVVIGLYAYRRWRSLRERGVSKENERIAASNEAIASDMNAKLRRLQTLADQVGTLCTDFCPVDCLSPKTVDFMGSLLQDKAVSTMDQAVQELSKSPLCDTIIAANAQIDQGYALLAERRADDVNAVAQGRAKLLGALSDASTFYATSMTERGAIRYLRNISEYGD